MADPQAQDQIEGLPPGAILKPIQQSAIQGLPPGAILKPIESSTAPVNPPMSRTEADAYLENLATGGQGTYQPPKTPKFGDTLYVGPNSPVFGERIQSSPNPQGPTGADLVPVENVEAVRQRMRYEAAHPDEMAKVAHSQAMDTSLPLAERLRARAGLEARKRTELGLATNAVNEQVQNYAGEKGANAGEAFAQFMAHNFQTENPEATPGEIGVARSVGKNAAQIAANPITYGTFAFGGAGGKAGQVALGALFAAGAGKASYDAAGQLGSIWDRPDITSQQKTEMASDLFLDTAMAGLAGGHAVKASFLTPGDPLLAQVPQEYRTAVSQKVNSVLQKTGGVLSRAGDLSAEVGNSDLEGITQQSLPSKAAASGISKALGGGPEAMAKRPIAQQTAAGTASNADVAAYAKSKGIDLLPGQATGARGLQTVQAIGERAVVAPGDLPDVLEKQKAAFGNAIDDFKQRVGTEAIPNTEAAGQSLKSQAQHGLDNLKQSAQQNYQAFQDQAGDIPVDLSDVKAKAQASLASQAEALKNVPAQYANPVRNVLKKLSDLQSGGEVDPKALADFNNAVDTYGLNPEQQTALRAKLGLPDEAGNSAVKMSTAQQLRSAYLDISRDYSGNVPKSVQRYAGQAAKDIDAAMAKAADHAGATDQWRQANAKWKQLQQTYNNPEHPLYKVLQEPDPSKVPSRLLGKGSYGGSPQTVRQLQQAGIDISPLKREVAQQIADRNFALTNGGRMLAGYSTEFLKTLYTPQEFNELTTMGRIGRAIRFEMNPSGTSNVQQGERQFHGIIHRTAGAVIGPAASRLTTSKALARATMGDIQPRGIADIFGGKPPELPPEEPPAGAAPSTPPSGPGTPPAPKPAPIAAAPRSLADILSSRSTAPISDKIGGAKVLAGDVPLKGPVSPVAADITRLKAELKTATDPKEIADIQQALEHAQARLEGRPYTPPEQAVVENLPVSQPRDIEPGIYNRETKTTTPAPKQSVNSAVHEVLGEMPSPEHKPTTPQQPMEAGKAVAGNYGNDTAVNTISGSLPAKYKVVEADSLIPSHNAQTFAKNPQYPEGVQERDYARSKEAQNRVIQQAQNYDPAYTVNTNPDAVNGPPVVTKDGIVLGGNSRTMSTQRLYQDKNAANYRKALAANAEQFGIDRKTIPEMKKPILVREVETPANIEAARRIGADLNRNMTGAMGQGEKAVSAGRSVKPQTLATISGMVNDMGEGATLRDVMRQHGKDIASMMVKDGVISDR
ncbi:MAG TPA: hypothetical protein VGR76_21240, partial [Candidatus Angelobacter sp.]|nr:hypothetical protein [Candidatus Angelobacter sp.]